MLPNLQQFLSLLVCGIQLWGAALTYWLPLRHSPHFWQRALLCLIPSIPLSTFLLWADHTPFSLFLRAGAYILFCMWMIFASRSCTQLDWSGANYCAIWGILSALTTFELWQLLVWCLAQINIFLPLDQPSALLLQLLFFAAASLILGFMGRVFLGKRSSLNHSLSAAMGILFIYAVAIVVYTFKPWSLDALLSPLPFVRFAGEHLLVIPFQGSPLTIVCSEILSLVILAFLVNLLDTLIPRGNSALGWFFLRILTVLFAMVLHILVDWAFKTYLPNVLVTYAPTILLVILAVTLLMGLLNLVLSVVLTVVNPIFGALYTFFFSNIIGKQLSKAVFTSGIICGVVFLLGYFGCTVICVSAAALYAYIPLAVVLLLLWFLIGWTL